MVKWRRTPAREMELLLEERVYINYYIHTYMCVYVCMCSYEWLCVLMWCEGMKGDSPYDDGGIFNSNYINM